MPQQITNLAIPQACTDTVVFVHGFGVRWDSRGMFTDLKEALPKGWGSVLFDFYQPEDDHVYVTTINDQIARLNQVLDETKLSAPNATIHIVAHSMGCIVAVLAQPEANGNVLLLAPARKFGGRMKEYFLHYPGAKVVKEHVIVPRKDGSTTHIPLAFFEQTATIKPIETMISYAKQHPLHILLATEDEVLKDSDYTALQAIEGMELSYLPADHNFTGENRRKLISYINDTLLSA